MTLASRLAGSRAVVVGDLMLDEQVWGEVNRISPEAPVPVVHVRGRTHVPGGAANVAAGIAALEGTATLVGLVGADAAGTLLREALLERRVDTSRVITASERCTTTKTRVIAQSQQIVRMDSEESTPLSLEHERELMASVENEMPSADVVVLSDYRKGVVTEAVATGVIESARRHGKPVVVDPRGGDYARYRGATLLTPNVQDAKRAAHFASDEFADLGEIAKRLAGTAPDSALLITRGSEGMTLVTAQETIDVPAEPQDVFDVTGAGDTVVATIAAALGRDWPMEKAVRLANAAAGIAVSKVGTITVGLKELAAVVDAPLSPD